MKILGLPIPVEILSCYQGVSKTVQRHCYAEVLCFDNLGGRHDFFQDLASSVNEDGAPSAAAAAAAVFIAVAVVKEGSANDEIVEFIIGQIGNGWQMG